ncbi:MAG: DUF1822 family protein [Cyanobacteria bacterium J06626_14]
MSVLFPTPLEWWLDVSAEQVADSRDHSQRTATPLSQRQAFLNHLCLHVMLPWLQAEYDTRIVPWPHPETLSSIWEMIDGVAIAFSNVRVLLVPSETIDTDGVSIPQEWVDIPSWAADYYIAVQINLEHSYLRAWGYTSHTQLKQKGTYDAMDRTYDIRREWLGQDFNVFWVTCQRCPEKANQEVRYSACRSSDIQCSDLLEFNSENAIRHLLQRPLPRLSLPFDQWSRLIQDHAWRQQFYEQRLFAMNPSVIPAFVNDLREWGGPQVLHEWHPLDRIDEVTHPAVRRSDVRPLSLSLRTGDSTTELTPQRIKLINFPIKPNPLSVMLFMSVRPRLEEKTEVAIQAHPLPEENHLPTDLTLELRDDFNQVIKTVRSHRRDSFIQFPILTCPFGTRFSLHLFFRECRVIEYFVAGSAA